MCKCRLACREGTKVNSRTDHGEDAAVIVVRVLSDQVDPPRGEHGYTRGLGRAEHLPELPHCLLAAGLHLVSLPRGHLQDQRSPHLVHVPINFLCVRGHAIPGGLTALHKQHQKTKQKQNRTSETNCRWSKKKKEKKKKKRTPPNPPELSLSVGRAPIYGTLISV